MTVEFVSLLHIVLKASFESRRIRSRWGTGSLLIQENHQLTM